MAADTAQKMKFSIKDFFNKCNQIGFSNFALYRSSLRGVLYKKDVLINFVKFTGKHLYQSLFLNNRVATQPEIQGNQGKVREFDFGL